MYGSYTPSNPAPTQSSQSVPSAESDYRSAAKSEKQDSKSDHDFTIGLDIPLRYSNGVSNPDLDTAVNKSTDGHVTPELYLKWSRQYDAYYASAQVGASIDRYEKTTSANVDAFYSSFKIEKTDGKWQYFVPYALVSNDVYFTPTFRTPEAALKNLAVGFYSGIAWRDPERLPYIDSLIPYPDAEKPGDVATKFDIRIGRRMSDLTEYQNNYVSAKAGISYYTSFNTRIEAEIKFRGQWYDNYFGEKRRDFRSGASLGLIWSPNWLKALSRRSELSLNFDFYHNQSSVADKSYTLWEVGPTISLKTKF